MGKPTSFLTSRGMAIACLLLAAGYFLVMRHWQHVLAFFPYLILLACPLMHLFMHGGHGGHAGHHKGAGGDTEEAAYRRGLEEGKKQKDE
jgi:ABC-type Fe3+ transport system permease subunit